MVGSLAEVGEDLGEGGVGGEGFEAIEVFGEEGVEFGLGVVVEALVQGDFGQVLAGGEQAEVTAQAGVGGEGFGLVDAIEGFALGQEQFVNDEEGGASAEFGFGFANACGDGSDETAFGGEDGEEAIVFAQGHTFEVDASDAIGTRHGLGWWASVSLLLRDRGLGGLGGRSVDLQIIAAIDSLDFMINLFGDFGFALSVKLRNFII